MNRWISRIFVLLSVPAVFVSVLAVPATSQAATVSIPDSFTFTGSGWGHGIGMSQVGARGQAVEGRTAKQILEYYYTGASVASFRDDMDLRVSMAYLKTSMRMRVEGLTSAPARATIVVGTKTVKLTEKDVAVISVVGTQTQVKRNGVLVATGSPIVVRWSGTRNPGVNGSAPSVLNATIGNTFDGDGHRYRYGKFELRGKYSSVAKRTTLTAVNVVRLHDEYLKGVAEVPSSWPEAALQAQVIAARSYALVKYRAGVRGGCWCHVFKDTRDLVFAGYLKESSYMGARWAAAVKATNVSATSSQTVLFQGAPAQAFFFHSTGGRTQNSEDVWGAKVSYLRSVDDHWSLDPKYDSSFALWGPKVRTQSTVASAFGLPNVVRLDLSDRYASGSVRTAKAWSSTGVMKTLAGGTATSRLSLLSRWFQVPGTTPVPSFTVAPASVSVQSIVGARAAMTGQVLPAKRAAGSTVILQRKSAVTGAWSDVTKTTVSATGTFTFSRPSSIAVRQTYRVVKGPVNCGGNCFYKGSSSRAIAVAFANKWAVAPAAVSRIVAQTQPVIRGTVAPLNVAAGSTVAVQRWNTATKTWVRAGSAVIDARGRFTAPTAGSPVGINQFSVLLPKRDCVAGLCMYRETRSAVVSVHVTKPFVVTAAGKGVSGHVVVAGSVSPAAVSKGKTVRVSAYQSGRWTQVGTATVTSTGTFRTTITRIVGKSVPFKFAVAGSLCVNGTCSYTAATLAKSLTFV
jgi:SpoIID/LytB domain protein